MRYVLLIFLFLSLMSCSSGSDSVTSPTGDLTGGDNSTNITINEVDPVNNLVEFVNNTESTINIGNYYLCALFNYERISTSNLVSGSLSLGPGEITLIRTNMNLNTLGSDLGLYVSNTFGNADAMIDFLQWGTAGNGRESVADTAGLWTPGDFIPLNAGVNESFTRNDATTNGISSWEIALKTFGGVNANASDVTRAVGGGGLVISEVDPINNTVEIYNGTGASIDLSTYWLCSLLNYEQLSSSMIVNGSLNLGDTEYLVIKTTGLNLNELSADLGLFNASTFGVASAMIDFVQWGSSGNGRETVAVTAGLWDSGDFIAAPTTGNSVTRLNSTSNVNGWVIESINNGSGVERNL